jgi:hypothetical protein
MTDITPETIIFALDDAETLLADIDAGWRECDPYSHGGDIEAVLGVYSLRQCRVYHDGTYDCTDAAQRMAAVEELENVIAALRQRAEG